MSTASLFIFNIDFVVFARVVPDIAPLKPVLLADLSSAILSSPILAGPGGGYFHCY